MVAFQVYRVVLYVVPALGRLFARQAARRDAQQDSTVSF